MSAIERIAYNVGRRDEVPNQELARDLAETRDTEGIAEIADHLTDGNASIASDCIKVMYEVGYIDPSLIEPYTDTFIDLLQSRKNRMVWGAMIAIWTVADGRYEVIWERLDDLLRAMDGGSVITVDAGVRALSVVASKGATYQGRLKPVLFGILEDCEAKRIPSFAESMEVMVDEGNVDGFLDILTSRYGELSSSQARRLDKVVQRHAAG